MDNIMQEKMRGLIQAYIKAKQARALEDENDYDLKIDRYRKWQCENILDLEKLKNYSDAEFAQKFGEMFDFSDGSESAHGLARGMHFKTDEKRLAIRTAFENLIGYINDHEDNRFELLEEVLSPTSPYKVPGLGIHMVTTLINAKYPDVPPINETTKDFFKNIGEPLPTKISAAQLVVRDFFENMLSLANDELNLDDVNHICWFSKTIDSGREYMAQNFPGTFDNTNRPRRISRVARKRILTPEERHAEILARLESIHKQANM